MHPLPAGMLGPEAESLRHTPQAPVATHRAGLSDGAPRTVPPCRLDISGLLSARAPLGKLSRQETVRFEEARRRAAVPPCDRACLPAL